MFTIRRWLSTLAEVLFAIPPTKEAADAHRNRIFDEAKRLSDFIGMIVRLAFLFYAVSYFTSQMFAHGDTLKGYAFGLCLTVSLGLSGIFGGQIFAIIYIHHLRDVSVQTNRWVRIAMFVSTVIVAGALWFGIVQLISALPKPGLKV
jgi:hypothetical protein